MSDLRAHTDFLRDNLSTADFTEPFGVKFNYNGVMYKYEGS